MPTTTSITTTYAGEFAGKYIAAALLSAPTLEQGGVTIVPNVKYKQVIKRVATNDILKNATCDFDATSTITLTERVLEVKDLQVNMQLCKSQFHDSWLGIEQGFSSFDVLPKSFSDYLIAHVAAQVASANEVSLWQGSSAVSGQFDGLFSTAILDPLLPPAQLITNVVITPANVIAQMQLVDDQIPASLYGKADLKIYVSQNVAKAYVAALGGFGAIGLGSLANAGTNAQGTQWYTNGALSFNGTPIFMANGLPDDSMLATTTSNLYFGCSLLSDTQEVRTIDMSDIDGSQNVRVIMRMAAGATYGVIEDIVVYG